MLQAAWARLTNPQERALWPLWKLVLTTAAITSLLILPAVYNRFPLVFPDTSHYFTVAYAGSWPLYRSGFYGLMLAPALLSLEPVAGAWLATAAQCGAISLVLVAVTRRVLPQVKPAQATALVAIAAIMTSLSWHASQLVPDAFSGALVLIAWLAATRNLAAPGTALLWLIAVALALVHYTHVGILAAAAATALVVSAFNESSFAELAKRALAAVVTVAAVIAAHTTIHGLYFGRWHPSPLGGYFLFARLNEDGLVPRWMDRHCGHDAPRRLCDLRSSLPRDSQLLLWGGEEVSPLYQHINGRISQPELWVWADMVSMAAVGSLKEEPAAFAANAYRATIEQLVHYQVLDDDCPEACRNMRMFEWRPSLMQPVLNSRQLMGELPERQIRTVTSASATLGLLLLMPLIVWAFRRRDTLALSMLLTIAVSLLANAAAAGALSDVHDRYQSRLVWLAPFAALLLVARWQSQKTLVSANSADNLVPASHTS